MVAGPEIVPLSGFLEVSMIDRQAFTDHNSFSMHATTPPPLQPAF